MPIFFFFFFFFFLHMVTIWAPFPNMGLRDTRAKIEVVKESRIKKNKVKRDNEGAERNKVGKNGSYR